jgi:iron complex outermembrane receptor protein
MIRKKQLAWAVAHAFGAGAFIASPVLAQQTSGEPVQRVEITGSAIRQIQTETALPVTIITADELARQGINSIEAAVSTIAQNQAAVGTSQGIGATTGGRASIDLRGLGTQNANSGSRTLVLLNGRRIANHAYSGAAADVNAIPMAAVDRIEILRDGASALYGSDAIAGVVNFVLKKDFQGVEVSAFKDILDRDNGDSSGVSLVMGTGSLTNDGFNLLATFNYMTMQAIPALSREYGRTGIRPDLGFTGDSGTPFPANLSQTGSTLAVLNPARVGGGTCPPLAFNNPNPATLNCRYDFSGLIDLSPDQEQTQVMGRAAWKFGDHVFAAEYVRADNTVTNRVAPTPVTGLAMPPTSPFFPGNGITPAIGGLDPTTGITLAFRTVPAGQRTDKVEASAQRGTLSLDGVIAGWDYSTAIWQSISDVDSYFTNGYVSRPAITAAMAAGLINPFGAQTAAGLAALEGAKIKAPVIDAKGKVSGFDGKISKEVWDLPAGPLALAVGLEARSENFQLNLVKDPATGVSFASQATSSGLEGTVDAGGKRDMYGFFGEVNIPLIRKQLDAQVSVRYDHYDLTGDTTNPKVGVRWTPVEWALFRASANTGFRAPSLYEIFNPQQTTFTSNAYNDPVLCPGGTPAAGAIEGRDCDQQFNSLFGGPVGVGRTPESLKAETSRNYTIGTVLEPVRNLTIGLDWWDIKVKDVIGQLPEQAIFADPTKYASRFVRCNAVSPANLANPQIASTCFDAVSGALQPTALAYIFQPTENLGEIRTNGLDVSLKYRYSMGTMGVLSFGLSGTWVNKYKYQREKDGVFIDAAGKYSDSGPIVRWKHVATANWDYGPWSTTLANRYINSYTDENNPDRVTDATKLGHKVDAYSVWDLFVAFKGVKNLTLRAGVKNILNEDPPASNQGATFQNGYDPRIHDILGRVYSIQASYKF